MSDGNEGTFGLLALGDQAVVEGLHGDLGEDTGAIRGQVLCHVTLAEVQAEGYNDVE